MKNVNLFRMDKKDFTFYYCGPNAQGTTTFIDPPPTCEVKKDKERRAPILLSQYSQIVKPILVPAKLCRVMKLTTKTWVNFIGDKSSTEYKKWIEVDPELCNEAMSGKLESKQKESLLPEGEQYFKHTPVYKWLQHVETSTTLYFILNTTLLIDVATNYIATPDKIRHNCHYKMGRCDIGSGGYIRWKITEEISGEVDCPYKLRAQEKCIAKIVLDHQTKFLSIICSESMTQHYVSFEKFSSKDSQTSLGKGCRTHLFLSHERNVLSFNLTAADSSDLLPKPTSLELLLERYSIGRVHCQFRSEESCYVYTKEVQADCKESEQTWSADCLEKISTWSPAFCNAGMCMLENHYTCVADKKGFLEQVNRTFADDFNVYKSLLQKHAGKGALCLDVYEERATLYEAGFWVRKSSDSVVLYSFVDQSSFVRTQHTYQGYTLQPQRRCKNKYPLTIAIKSYKKAINHIKSLDSFPKLYLCECLVGDTTIQVAESIEPSKDTSDFIWEYTGFFDTDKSTASTVDSQLNFLYSSMSNLEDHKMAQVEATVCLQKLAEWHMQYAMNNLNQNIFPGSNFGPKTRTTLHDLTVVKHACVEVDTYRLLDNDTQCYENVAIQVQSNSTVVNAYLNRLSRVISQNKGKAMACKDRDPVLNIGYQLMVLYNKTGTYLLSKLKVPQEYEGGFRSGTQPIMDLVGLEHDSSLIYQVEELQGIVYNALSQGTIQFPMENIKYDNTIGDIGQSVSHFSIGKVFGGKFSSIVSMITVIAIVIGAALAIKVLNTYCNICGRVYQLWRKCRGRQLVPTEAPDEEKAVPPKYDEEDYRKARDPTSVTKIEIPEYTRPGPSAPDIIQLTDFTNAKEQRVSSVSLPNVDNMETPRRAAGPLIKTATASPAGSSKKKVRVKNRDSQYGYLKGYLSK